MLVGEPFGSKTSVLRVLASTLNSISQSKSEVSESLKNEGVVYSTINPKAITVAQLYGAFDCSSQEVTLFYT